MTIRTRTLYEAAGHTLEFIPLERVPGFTHRAVVDGKQVGWLSSDFKPSKKAAEYFFEKVAAKAAA